jgi:hypothetical protein
LETAQVEEALVTFVAMPLIMIIALYLLACAIAPLIHMNSQIFSILFTVAGGVPTLFLYQKRTRATKPKERKPRKRLPQ